MRGVLVAVAAAFLVTAGSDAAAQTNVYRWVDSQGNVHFSDTPPPPESKGVTQKRMGGGVVEENQLPFATQLAMRKSPVTLYTAPACGDPCASGRNLLASRGIPYTERDAQANPADAQALKKLIGALQVPVLLVGETRAKGYDANAWHSVLDAAGYPRTRLPGTVTPRPNIAPAPPAAEAEAPAGAAPAPPTATQ